MVVPPSQPDSGEWATDESTLIRSLFDHLPAMVAFWDADARNVLANDAYLVWFGWTPERLKGRHISELLGEELYQLNLPYITRALAGEEQLFTRTLVDTLGRTRHVQASYVPHRVAGVVRGFFVLVTDVTPRIVAETELAEAQQLARLGSWVQYVATGEMHWSQEMFSILGLPDDATPDVTTIASLTHPDDVERVRRVAQESLEAGVDSEQVFRIVRPDGQTRVVHSRTSMVKRDGTVVSRRGTLLDETESWRTNEALRRSNELLADVIGMIGHDLRNPATAITGVLALVDQQLGDDVPDLTRGLVRRALASGRRLNALLENVLAMAVLDSGDATSAPTAFPVAASIREALADVDGGEDVSLEADQDLHAMADPNQLAQVVANLVVNALRYGAPPVEVTAHRVGDLVEILVADHGPGVPDELRPRLFERFSRGDAGPPGTGLGLYLSRRLCESNGGNLRCDPGPAQSGARFVATFPAAPAQ